MSPRPARALVLFAVDEGSRTLAYQHGWPRHFARHPAFDCVPVNICGGLRATVAAHLAVRRSRAELVILLHSVFSNEQRLRGALLHAVASLPQPKAVFLGNEYKLMPEKMAFCNRLGVSLLVSQLSSPEAHELYRQRLGCAVAAIPNAALDMAVFAPKTPWRERPVDVGYRAHDAPPSIGHDERRLLGEVVAEAARARGLVVDASLDPADRFGEAGWAAFLDRCKAQLGSEAGGDRFELSDATRLAVIDFLAEHPDAGDDEVFTRFFADGGTAVSGRALSGRVVDAAGTKTVQVLLDGEYGGYLRPDVHYIPLHKDLSNLDAALDKLRDEALCRELAEAAYDVAVSELTYERLIDRFAEAARGFL